MSSRRFEIGQPLRGIDIRPTERLSGRGGLPLGKQDVRQRLQPLLAGNLGHERDVAAEQWLDRFDAGEKRFGQL